MLAILYHKYHVSIFKNMGVAENGPRPLFTLHLEPPLLKFLEISSVPDCLVSSLCYHGSLKRPLRIRLRMEVIDIELNCLTTSCQTRKHCHTT